MVRSKPHCSAIISAPMPWLGVWLYRLRKASGYGWPPLASDAPIGVRDIDSTPPATTTS